MAASRPDSRIVDLVILAIVALPGLIIGAACAIAVRMTSPGPVLFRQERIGRNGEPFTVLKFRTMIDEPNPIFPDATRITTAGRFLRRFSLDELPQLINVAQGDMSIVGPRPTLAYQVERYDDHQRRRLEVRPGLTGLAQVSGRNALSWTERIELDVTYVETRSIPLDISIIVRTAKALLGGEGVDGHPTDDALADIPPTRPHPVTLRRFVIVGAGGHGREVLDIVEAMGRREDFAGFVDDSVTDPKALQRLEGRQTSVVGSIEWLASATEHYVIGIGSSEARRRIEAKLAGGPPGREALVLVHPSASLGSRVDLAPGVIVGAHATLTTNLAIGRHSHVNVGCAVQHDSTLGDYVTVSPGVFINGDVTIGNDVFIGTGAVIARGRTIGDGSVIGAGAVVLDDVARGSRVFGVPARTKRA